MNLMVLAAGVVGEIKTLGEDHTLSFVFLTSHLSIHLKQLQTTQAEPYTMLFVCFTRISRLRTNSCRNEQLHIRKFAKFSASSPCYTWDNDVCLNKNLGFESPMEKFSTFPLSRKISEILLWRNRHDMTTAGIIKCKRIQKLISRSVSGASPSGRSIKLFCLAASSDRNRHLCRTIQAHL